MTSKTPVTEKSYTKNSEGTFICSKIDFIFCWLPVQYLCIAEHETDADNKYG